MKFCTVALVLAAYAPISLGARPDSLPRDESPIVLPPNYEAEYTYSLPYTATFLPDGGLSYPVKLWVNSEHDMVRLDTYDSLDSELHRDGAVYYRMPRMDQYSCQWWRTGERSLHATHQTAAHFLSAVSQKPEGAARLKQGGGVPDFEEWKFDKELDYNGVPAERWTYKVKVEERVSHYAVIVSKEEGLPLYLHMLGGEIVAHAHYDEYVMNFTSFKAVASNDLANFEVPVECETESALETMPSRPLSLALASLVPGAEVGPTEYSDFRAQHGRDAEDTPTHTRRAHTFLRHSTAVKQHNLQKDRRFTMEVNKFADWTHAEFSAGMLGFKRSADTRTAIAAVQSGAASPAGSAKRSKFQHTPGFAANPGGIDWRGSGAVGPVKDQGVCGSCWTFSASQAVSSAHWMETGEYVSLSEQQLMDCSWEYGPNSACNGGDPDLAVQYAIDTGGCYTEKDYPYKGVDDFCKAGGMTGSIDASPSVTPASVVYIESKNIEAVKEALKTHGPVSVGIDAEPIPFRFYSEGVLDTPECSSEAEFIDHAVLLVGYGEEDGVPFWIIKNEWSAHWGDEGYIKVAQDNDCGIATEAFFVIANSTMT